MIIIDMEGEFIPNLLAQLAAIPGVVQVRCNKPLRQKYKEIVGDDGVFISLFVQRKDGTDFFIRFEDYYPLQVANDPSQHEAIITNMALQVENYLIRDIDPTYVYGEGLNNSASQVVFNKLIEDMSKINGVVQMRYHNPLKKQYVDMIGKDGYIITAYVAHKEIEDFYIPFVSMAPKNVCFNKDKHDSLIEHLRTRIYDYITNDVTPANTVSIDEMQILQV